MDEEKGIWSEFAEEGLEIIPEDKIEEEGERIISGHSIG